YQARRRIAFTLIPMAFVLTTTLWALVRLMIGNFELAKKSGATVELVNSITSLILIVLALFVVGRAFVALRGERKGTLLPETA
ncbi:MAG TPA: hypothetical protein VMT00_04160, partial [Thermoanaerobaculia bacterium]|nr:hypothetical protein [Thermoanaerobaculia bacterium]